MWWSRSGFSFPKPGCRARTCLASRLTRSCRKGCPVAPLPSRSEMTPWHPKRAARRRTRFFSSVPPVWKSRPLSQIHDEVTLCSTGALVPSPVTESTEHFVAAFAVPVGRNTKGDGPVGGVLPDWRIPIIHQLVAVVLELLPEVIEHRPSFMASRATQTIFSGKGGQSVSVVN